MEIGTSGIAPDYCISIFHIKNWPAFGPVLFSVNNIIVLSSYTSHIFDNVNHLQIDDYIVVEFLLNDSPKKQNGFSVD